EDVQHFAVLRIEGVDVSVVRLGDAEGAGRLVPVQPVRARIGERDLAEQLAGLGVDVVNHLRARAGDPEGATHTGASVQLAAGGRGVELRPPLGSGRHRIVRAVRPPLETVDTAALSVGQMEAGRALARGRIVAV